MNEKNQEGRVTPRKKRLLIAVLVLTNIVTVLILLISRPGISSDAKLVDVVRTQRQTIYNWPGPSDAQELIVDEDQDGNSEKWIMSLWRNTETKVVASLLDYDDNTLCDGMMLEAQGADGREVTLVLKATRGDGVLNSWAVGVKEENECMTVYMDRDSDGSMETKAFRTSDELPYKRYVLREDAWIPETERPKEEDDTLGFPE